MEHAKSIAFIATPIILIIGLIIGLEPEYSVWSAKMAGEAELARATQNRQIIVQEANAQKEAEIARAQGTAEANKIIGQSLKDNPAYLQWLYITGMSKEVNKTVVYVPNPGLVPSLETGRIGTDGQK